MKKQFTLSLLGITLSLLSMAQGKNIIAHQNQLNKFATALYEKIESECVFTDVMIQTADKVMIQTNGGGKPFTTSFSYLLIARGDVCAQEWLTFIESAIPEGSAPENNLTACSMDETMTVQDDVSGNIYTARVKLDWTGVGGMVNLTDNIHLNFRTFQYYMNQHGVARDAKATGSVTLDGGANLIADEDLVYAAIIKGGGSTNINIHLGGPSSRIKRVASGEAAAPSVSVYPNPASNLLHVRAGDAIRYRLVNAMGAVMAESNIENPDMIMDVSLLSPGIYQLQLQSATGDVVKRFVKE